MGSEIFRFVTVRPPRALDTGNPPTSIDLEDPKSELTAQLRKKRPTGTRAEMIAIGAKFIGSPAFVASASALQEKLAEFAGKAVALPGTGFWKAAQQLFTDTIGGKPGEYLKSAEVAKRMRALIYSR